MRSLRIDVKTAVESGLQGASDTEVLEAASRAGRSILTQDLDFGRIFVERSPAVQIVVLRSRDARPDSLARLVDDLVKAVDLDAPKYRSALVVVGEHGYRTRLRTG